MMNYLKRYLSLSTKRSILFNTVNNVTLFIIGDIIQQNADLNKKVLKKDSKNTNKSFNYYQTFKITTYAVLLSPVLYPFYVKILPRMCPVSNPATLKEIARKVAVDYALAGSL